MSQQHHLGDDMLAFSRPAWYSPDGLLMSNPLPGLTARQYAAIHLCVPDSGLPWLDAMIDRARRDRFAAAMLPDAPPEMAIVLADAMLAAAKGGQQA